MTAQETPHRPIQVLVVDDSAVARQALSSVLAADPRITTIVAADAVVAAERIKVRRPDVILLDLEMPRIHGLSFLRQLMADNPIPVVVCSNSTGRGSAAALQALAAGAVDAVPKPRLGSPTADEDAASVLDAVREAASARLLRRIQGVERDTLSAPRPRRTEPRRPMPAPVDGMLIAIAASTGGTEAIATVLADLPAGGPPVVVVQHMAAPFTAPFARALDREVPMTVREAGDGDDVRAGLCLIAPGNRHMRVVRHVGGYRVRLDDGPRVNRHRPSADVLFGSVATAAGRRAVGVILTGMGDDGATGLLEMRQAGAVTIGQDEATCVVYGMPQQARRRGAVVWEVPIDRVAETIATALHEAAPRGE